MNKLRVLHIAQDDKFFDNIFNKWKDDDQYDNRAVIIKNREDYSFRYIKSIKDVTVLYNKAMVKDCLRSSNYDIIYLYSLSGLFWKYCNYIPKDKIVIWWGWGYDLYGRYRLVPPHINVQLYKIETRQYILRDFFRVHNLITFFPKLLQLPINTYYKYNVIKRVDYFQPVTAIEYDLMKHYSAFRAKEYYTKDSYSPANELILKKNGGNVLLGNSSTPTNNHLDILSVINNKLSENQSIVLPLSYGDMKYRNWLVDRISNQRVLLLKDYLTLSEYNKIIDSCSYACFGVMRQQAMGNITYALKTGMKVFLYKDSVAYKSLKKLGFIIFAIEDINETSFSSPLTEDEARTNYMATIKEAERRNQIYKKCTIEISARINSR